MLPPKFRTLFTEVVKNHRREHQAERDEAIKKYTFKMADQHNNQSSEFNNGKVKIYCEAFKKFADGVWGGMQRVMEGGFEIYPGCEDDLINFLKESLTAVYEADTKSLFAIKNNVHTPTARHLARCKPRFEFRCQAATEKLTTEIKIFVNQLQMTNEKEASLATIEGQKRQVTGFDEQGNLVLADGKRYTFERLNYKPSGQPPDEPDGDIFGWPLLEAVRLQQWQGDWKWNDEPLTLIKWMESELQNLCDKRGILPEQRTEQIKISAILRVKPGELHLHYMTREIVYSRLKHLPDAFRQQVNGVAWFGHDDGEGGWNTPILLKSFRPLPASAKPEQVINENQNNTVPVGNRFRYSPGFNEVWLDGKFFDLRSRRKARACLQYLVEQKAFDENTARHLETEIDPYVRKLSGDLPPPHDIRIHHYFTAPKKRLKKLCDLIKAVGRNGRYYLKLT
jgi:hypothetical protein